MVTPCFPAYPWIASSWRAKPSPSTCPLLLTLTYPKAFMSLSLCCLKFTAIEYSTGKALSSLFILYSKELMIILRIESLPVGIDVDILSRKVQIDHGATLLASPSDVFGHLQGLPTWNMD